ncbi:uncharacterized protein CDV56_100995 [Aspergillus thermomutatus]|uniref:LysM domain-containing protein n=1 Tax=Aspergillus thermomutatus TaxID=41047 RepID=A0A397H594_ASPTH|nr:uncharacterized protein CDV56_100995 [Aspergillus thermomutatus]RHZ56573.1 hypothetical protein CDV56_100995 [Aspergillus thermomutatus]
MYLTLLLTAGLVPGMAAALSRRAVECDFSTTADAGATCSSFASSWGLSVDTLQQLNPGISCPNLDTSQSYCVISTVTDDPTSTSTTLTTTTSTTTTKTAPSNSPTMPGIADNCDGFYKVSSGDQCDTIAAKHGISVAQFKSWNTEINDDCTNLWLDYYVCVHVPGATTTSQAPKPTDEPSGPTPQMPGIVDNCKTFHLIKSGESCRSIYTDAGITFAQFRAWNTQVDAACTNLWLGYYVCLGEDSTLVVCSGILNRRLPISARGRLPVRGGFAADQRDPAAGPAKGDAIRPAESIRSSDGSREPYGPTVHWMAFRKE